MIVWGYRFHERTRTHLFLFGSQFVLRINLKARRLALEYRFSFSCACRFALRRAFRLPCRFAFPFVFRTLSSRMSWPAANCEVPDESSLLSCVMAGRELRRARRELLAGMSGVA